MPQPFYERSVLCYNTRMVFSSLTFLLLFLPAMLAAYFACRSIRLRNAVLLIGSLIFYASLFKAMTAGSMLGAVAGGLMLGLLSSSLLTSCLGVLLLFSAWKTFNHDRTQEHR